MQSQIQLPIRLLLEFFDEAPEYARGHANAIVAVLGEELGAGLLVDYFCHKGLNAESLGIPCTQGTKAGKRLDRWIRITKGGKITYFQVEIKNWSATAIGGRRLAIDASKSQLREHKMERWSKEWNGNGFVKEAVRKVLTPMKPPVINATVEPLACFWDAMHPAGKSDALFSIPVPVGNFPHVWIFSMSAYLRNLFQTGQEFISIDAPAAKARLDVLNKLLNNSEEHR
jgi:hypothetical protein